MTLLDIAQAARGKLRDGYSAPQAGGAAMVADMAYGTATADSSNGFVTIVMDNMPAGAVQADYEFTVACDAPITNGDRVALITINGTEKAISLTTTARLAQEGGVANYFWADTAGVHVSTEEDNPDGASNILLDSSGLFLRQGSDTVASFEPTSIRLGTPLVTGNVAQIDFFGLGSYLRFNLGGTRDRLTMNSGALYLTSYDGVFVTSDPNVGEFRYNGRKVLTEPQTLYSSSTGVGANSTLTLSETAADFGYLDFIYTDGTRQYCERLYNPNGKATSLFRSVTGSNRIYNSTLMVSVSGTTVTLGAETTQDSSGTAISTYASTNLKVIAVYGGTESAAISAAGVVF